mmetsp:Transcript_40989/g.73416  ORF Transcript_40989/g.73416 Transcript_40989/m.73416 type:complete len:106 (-) Transcript_40989:4-321(-)
MAMQFPQGQKCEGNGQTAILGDAIELTAMRDHRCAYPYKARKEDVTSARKSSHAEMQQPDEPMNAIHEMRPSTRTISSHGGLHPPPHPKGKSCSPLLTPPSGGLT